MTRFWGLYTPTWDPSRKPAPTGRPRRSQAIDPMSGRMITMSSQKYFGRFRQRTSSVEITSRMQKIQRTRRERATTPSPKITAPTSLARQYGPDRPSTTWAKEKGPLGQIEGRDPPGANRRGPKAPSGFRADLGPTRVERSSPAGPWGPG